MVLSLKQASVFDTFFKDVFQRLLLMYSPSSLRAEGEAIQGLQPGIVDCFVGDASSQ
jgi:hypothetical protein